jgi:DNA-binding response OmpR family regulator
MPARILVVDDDPDVRIYLQMVLAPHFSLLIARDGEEGWRLFQEEKPRLVLSDLNMPGLNGQELAQRIRSHTERADTPIIILTGTTRDTDLPPGFWRIGTEADAYLDKPVKPDPLIEEIRRQLLRHAQKKSSELPPGRGFY